jgi:hypothetical protein
MDGREAGFLMGETDINKLKPEQYPHPLHISVLRPKLS